MYDVTLWEKPLVADTLKVAHNPTTFVLLLDQLMKELLLFYFFAAKVGVGAALCRVCNRARSAGKTPC